MSNLSILKTGKAKAIRFSTLEERGDGGTEAAAKNGNITTITHLDSRTYQVLFGLYSQMDTIAYGD